MRKLWFSCAIAILAFWVTPAFATPANAACPVFTGGSAGGVNVLAQYIANSGGVNGGCNVLITFNANSSVVTTFPNIATSYDDGLDDNMVGIVNLTSSPIFSVNLTGSMLPGTVPPF